MEFLGISFSEFLLIVIVIVIVLGPNKIPGIMRTIGTVVRNIRKITSELTTNIAREIELDKIEKPAAAKPPAKPPVSKAPSPALPKPAPEPPPDDESKHDEQ